MSKLNRIIFTIGCLSIMTIASGETTQTISGNSAKVLYKALIQADLPYQETAGVVTVKAENIACSIARDDVYPDGISRGHCSGITSTAAAIMVASALIDAGVDADPSMSQTHPAAKKISCFYQQTIYTCNITANFLINSSH